MRYLILTLLLACTPLVHAADPIPAPTPAIIFPDLPTPPTPAPNPAAPVQLDDGVYYVIRSASPILAMSSPAGVLTLTKETGPLRIRGRFVDGSGKVETRNFAEKYLLIVEAAATGKAELFVAASPVTDEAQVVKRCIAANVGPVVPPAPPVPPTPSDPLTAALQAAYTAEVAPDKAKSLAFLAGMYASLSTPPGTVTTNAAAVAWLKSNIEAANPPVVGDPRLTPTQLAGVRKAIGGDLLAAWGATIAPVSAANVKAEVVKISNALAGVK